jgi:hypothetical protein
MLVYMTQAAAPAPTFMRYWHIAHPTWTPDQPLRSRNALLADGVDIPWLWDEADEGTDCGIVCLFPDTEQGCMEAGWLADDRPGYAIVQVDIPEDADIFMTRAEWEGYPAVQDEIPAAYLTAVEKIRS